MPRQNKKLLENKKWRDPFIVEITAWTGVGINVKNWNNHISPTDKHHFHLWMPDISMQFLKSNNGNLVLPDLYLMNMQEVKSKYGINPNSARGAMAGNNYHFGNYSNFEAWQNSWGWHYSHPWENIHEVKDRYEGTLIYDFVNHNIEDGPLKNYDLGDY